MMHAPFVVCWEDGAHSTRYTPYSPNSGFYYVRSNDRTRYFFEVFMRVGDQIMGTYFDLVSTVYFEVRGTVFSNVNALYRLTRSVWITSIGYEWYVHRQLFKTL